MISPRVMMRVICPVVPKHQVLLIGSGMELPCLTQEPDYQPARRNVEPDLAGGSLGFNAQ